jgi:hypothetical protein
MTAYLIRTLTMIKLRELLGDDPALEPRGAYPGLRTS